MKKIIFALIFLALISPVFAQQENNTSEDDMYYVNVRIEKIYQCNLGYVILYRKGSNQIGTTSVPVEWFNASAGKAEVMILQAGRDWPTMSVFYKNGEFSHVRIYVHRNRRHRSWGLFHGTVDVSQYFTDSETLEIQF